LPPNFRYDAGKLDRFLAMLPRDTDQASALARRRDAKVKGRSRTSFGPARPLRHAMEIRNDTFIDPFFVALLRKHRVALVIADTAGKWPQYEDVTADFLYIRLHGDEELYKSAYIEGAYALSQTHQALERGRGAFGQPPNRRQSRGGSSFTDVFCYFDNTDKVEAPGNALRLMRKLDVVWPIQPRSRTLK
jgi:uncharacterized protein YecE (DUF72 family)